VDTALNNTIKILRESKTDQNLV